MTKNEFIRVYEKYCDAIFRHCYFRVYSRELAEDLMQETFKKLWLYVIKGTKIENPKALLYRIAGNLAIDYKRRNNPISLDRLKEKGFEPEGENHEEHIYTKLEVQRIIGLLRKLDERSRAIILMRYVDGLTPKEIAKILGRSQNVVSVSLTRAIKKARVLIQETQS